MITIQIRQNPKGNWWCNTTYNGYDYSVERLTIVFAIHEIIQEIRKAGFNFTEPILLEPAKLYEAEAETQKPYTKVRIDHNPQG